MNDSIFFKKAPLLLSINYGSTGGKTYGKDL